VWIDLLPVLFLLMLPLVLIAGLLIAYARYRDRFLAIGLSQREMGLLAIGPFAAMLFDVPVFISTDYFLAMNIGGAIVPVIVSLHLIWKQRPSIVKTVLGIAIVSAASFMITRVTDLGVVASFPFYLLPSVLAALLALLLCSHRSPSAPAYAYAVATFGVLIGGDIFHLPEIFSEPFMGSLGGAGLYDMVYISGLLAISLVMPTLSSEIKHRPTPSSAPSVLFAQGLRAAHFDEGRKYLVQAVECATARVAQRIGSGTRNSVRTIIGSIAGDDFFLLQQKPLLNDEDFKKAAITTRMLTDALTAKERHYYATALQRTVAFLIDGAVLSVLALLLALATERHLGSLFFIFLFSLQFIYFTLLEYVAGATLGKALVGISVELEDGNDIDFITSFARNTIRFFDMLFGGYLISLLTIAISPKKQRLGDRVAGSVVVRST